jgi:hypothetical protein
MITFPTLDACPPSKQTPVGRTVLDRQRRGWQAFVAAISRITGLENA